MPLEFDEELGALLKRAHDDGLPFETLEYYVAELFRKHGREVPPPITGTVNSIEPEDRFG